MTINYNIYCDESSHLEKDTKTKFMVIGSIWVQHKVEKLIEDEISKIVYWKTELHWSNLRNQQFENYKKLIDFYFKVNEIGACFYRAVLIDKELLNHSKYQQNHNEFIYKMYYQLCKTWMKPCASKCSFKLIIDEKDTNMLNDSKKLKENLKHYSLIDVIPVDSKSSRLVQLADFFSGAVAFKNNHYEDDKIKPALGNTKTQVVDYLSKQSHLTLKRGTGPRNMKFNIFYWHPPTTS